MLWFPADVGVTHCRSSIPADPVGGTRPLLLDGCVDCTNPPHAHTPTYTHTHAHTHTHTYRVYRAIFFSHSGRSCSENSTSRTLDFRHTCSGK